MLLQMQTPLSVAFVVISRARYSSINVTEKTFCISTSQESDVNFQICMLKMGTAVLASALKPIHVRNVHHFMHCCCLCIIINYERTFVLNRIDGYVKWYLSRKNE